jgi:hypothetical protein
MNIKFPLRTLTQIVFPFYSSQKRTQIGQLNVHERVLTNSQGITPVGFFHRKLGEPKLFVAPRRH